MKKASSLRVNELIADELRALKRAAKNALKLAQQTGTPCYVMEGDKIVDIAKRGKAKSKSKKKRRSA